MPNDNIMQSIYYEAIIIYIIRRTRNLKYYCFIAYSYPV